MYYQNINSGYQSQYIGSTDSYGNFSTTISTSACNISAGSTVYVLVNNQQSQTVTWLYGYNPYGYNYNAYGYNYSAIPPVTINPSNLNLSINQSLNVAISGGSYNDYYGVSYYVGYNSNHSSVRTSLNGNLLTLTGLANSVTVIVVCSSSNSCGAVTVSVRPLSVTY